MKQVLQIVSGCFFLWTSILHAEVNIEITKGIDIVQPVGVVPFKWTGPGILPEDAGGIIASDLRNSGRFKPLEKLRLPQQPATASEITPAAWTSLGITTVIVGQIQPSADDSYVVSYQLVDTSSNSNIILANNQLKVAHQWLRYAVHTISDETFEKLTGIKGIFRTRIAYVVQTNSDQYPYELRIADYDGYNQMLVHQSTQPLMSPAWSLDGQKLAYVTFENGHSELVIQTLDSGAIYKVANFPQHNGAPSFSPDGTKLAFALSKTGSMNLYIMNLESGKIHQVTDDHSNNTEPTWFSDSQTLAYTSDQGGRPQIYKININGGIPQRLSWEGLKNQDADVSSDDKFLIMVNSNNGAQHIAKLDLITGSVKILTNTFLDETPSIAPNNSMIIYSTSQGIGSILQIASIDGHYNKCLLISDGSSKSPAWSPYL